MSAASAGADSAAASEASRAGSWGLRFTSAPLLPAPPPTSDLTSETSDAAALSASQPDPSSSPLAICPDYLLFPGNGSGEWAMRESLAPKFAPFQIAHEIVQPPRTSLHSSTLSLLPALGLCERVVSTFPRGPQVQL